MGGWGGVAGWQSGVEIEEEEKVEGKKTPINQGRWMRPLKGSRPTSICKDLPPLKKNIRKNKKGFSNFFCSSYSNFTVNPSRTGTREHTFTL